MSQLLTRQVAEGDEDEDGGEDHEDEVQLDALGLRQRQRVISGHNLRPCTEPTDYIMQTMTLSVCSA